MNIVYGLSAMALCLLIQSLLLIVAVQYYIDHKYLVTKHSFLSGFTLINTVMVIMLAGNFSQIALWGGLFQLLGEFDHYRDAFYHSAVNFSTLGYGDIVMSEQYRILGPLEAVNGVLMIGMSSAALIAVIQKILQNDLTD